LSQLLFVALSSLVLWLVFVFFQTVRHRDYFLPTNDRSNEEVHAPPPSTRLAGLSLALLIVSLVAIVGLATLSPLESRCNDSPRRAPVLLRR
jgi:Ca2+:H+ antiporter